MRAKINLYHGDCMEAMAEMQDNQYDLAIADPPYGIGLGMSDKKQVKNKTITRGHLQKKWNDTTPSAKYFEELQRVSKHQIIWGANYYWKYIKAVGAIIHDKQVTPFIASTYSHADIASCSLQKRITIFSHQWSGNVQNGKMNTKNVEDIERGLENRIHPTQKPVALYRWLLENYAKEGNTILDTHGGSMSIALACWDLKYDLDLWELDEDYYNAGKKRFEDYTAQGQFNF